MTEYHYPPNASLRAFTFLPADPEPVGSGADLDPILDPSGATGTGTHPISVDWPAFAPFGGRLVFELSVDSHLVYRQTLTYVIVEDTPCTVQSIEWTEEFFPLAEPPSPVDPVVPDAPVAEPLAATPALTG